MKLLVMCLAFLLLLGLFRLVGGRYTRRRWRTDLAWFFLLPLVGKPLLTVLVFAGALPLLVVRGPLGPAAALPLGVQGLLVLLITDFTNYWLHRLHHGAFWPTHAVHHSSRDLDWLSSVRVHPLNTLAQRLPTVMLLLILGFDLASLGGAAGFLALYGVLLHARVDWDFGPLRRVIASPRFHRWHHSSEVDCNYAGLFPVWDLLFGTFHLPDRGPTRFGVRGEPLPEGFVAQLAWPLRRKR